jgi:hypothetical protein
MAIDGKGRKALGHQQFVASGGHFTAKQTPYLVAPAIQELVGHSRPTETAECLYRPRITRTIIGLDGPQWAVQKGGDLCDSSS